MAKRYERVEGGGTRPRDAQVSRVLYNVYTRFSQMKAVFDTEWRIVLVHGLARDKFMNEKAILVVALNVFCAVI